MVVAVERALAISSNAFSTYWMIYEEDVVRAAKIWFGGLETYGNDGSETRSDDELEQTQVEGLVGINDKDDDIFDTGEAAEGSG